MRKVLIPKINCSPEIFWHTINTINSEIFNGQKESFSQTADENIVAKINVPPEGKTYPENVIDQKILKSLLQQNTNLFLLKCVLPHAQK